MMEGERNDGGVCVLRGVAAGKNRESICVYIVDMCGRAACRAGREGQRLKRPAGEQNVNRMYVKTPFEYTF